ncbi:MAG: polysaccharide export protein [Desulfobulbaceae bacterium]|nr:polysaccharide export protein [Desulfobulbaceae bacterium]
MKRKSQPWYLSILLIVFCIHLVPTTVWGKQTLDTAYKVGPGDIIALTIIAGGVEQTKANLVVSEDGEITVPFIGNMKASGLTFKNLEKKIYIPLEKDYFVDPQVNIQMKEYHSLSFTISGAVDKPGNYKLDFHPSIMDLIAKAGGVKAGRGNVAYVIRQDQGNKKPQKIDLTKLLDEGDMSQNVMLATGDKVHIPLGTKLNQSITKIYLEGEIKNPGMIDYQPGLSALSACIMAGGFSKYAAPNRTKIIRKKGMGYKVIEVNLEKVKDGKLADVPLKPGDRIHIPETWM